MTRLCYTPFLDFNVDAYLFIGHLHPDKAFLRWRDDHKLRRPRTTRTHGPELLC